MRSWRPIVATKLGDAVPPQLFPQDRSPKRGRPEGTNHWDDSEVFPDRGCSLSPSCLDCWLPKCRYDMSVEEREPYRQLLMQQQRSRKL
jgi:hypothetical protein